MLAQKKMLSPEELEAQTMWELPARELMHVSHKGSHAHAAPTTTTTTTLNCGATANQRLAALLIFAPQNFQIPVSLGNCNTIVG